MLNHFNRVRLFVTLWTVACKHLCPWESPGKNTGVGCHALLQGIFPTGVSYVSLIDGRVPYHCAIINNQFKKKLRLLHYLIIYL